MEAASTPERTRPKRVARGVLLALILVPLWAVLFKGCAGLCEPSLSVVWVPGAATTFPRDYRFIGFPLSAGVKTFDARGGKEVGVLTRAVGISVEEESAEWVGVGNGAAFVRRADLTLYPPDNTNDLMAGYNQARQGEYAFVSAELRTRVLPDKKLLVSVHENDDHSVTEYRYTVENDRGIPREVAYAGFDYAFRWLGRAALFFPLTLVMGVFLTKVFMWACLRDRTTRPRTLEAHTFGRPTIVSTDPQIGPGAAPGSAIRPGGEGAP